MCSCKPSTVKIKLQSSNKSYYTRESVLLEKSQCQIILQRTLLQLIEQQIAHKHNIQIHLYADDTQLYIPFNPEQSEEAMGRLESCNEDIRDWMDTNFLKLSDSKTEFIIFSTRKNVNKVTEWTVNVGHYRVFTVREKHRSTQLSRLKHT